MTILAEDLLLLALHDEKGKKESSVHSLVYGLSGGLIAELALLKKIRLVDSKIEMIDHTPTGNELLNAALQIITKAKNDKEIKNCLADVSKGIKNLQELLTSRLINQGILYLKEDKFLGIFTRMRYPTRSPEIEMDLRDLIRKVLLYDQEPDDRTLLLISISKACKVLPVLFISKNERKIAEKRADELTEREGIAQSIKEIVDEISAAIVMMIVMTAVI
ncbi:MAG: GOLPH3/VPS74 family protein [Candidatus Hodarchaeales archaeon]|jgi:hypothetical protein